MAAIVGIMSVCGLYARNSDGMAGHDGFEKKPLFLGGPSGGFSEWVQERLVFPDGIKAEGIGGRVLLAFTVMADGTVDSIKVLRGIDPRLDAEAVRVVAMSPKWTPAEQLGKKIRTRFTFPVEFSNPAPNPYPVESFAIGGEGDSLMVYCVKHGSVVLKLKRTKRNTGFSRLIAVDPVKEFYGRPVPYGWFKGCDAVLVTHDHGDHLDTASVGYLSNSRHGTRVIGSGSCIDKLGHGKVLHNGESDTLFVIHRKTEDFPVVCTAVPAYNTTSGFHPKGTGNGYLIEVGGYRVYIAGDTEPIPEMRSLGKVDLAFLPCNQPYTMTPKQLRKAARMVGAGVVIPYHMGETDFDKIRKALRRYDVRLHEELR